MSKLYLSKRSGSLETLLVRMIICNDLCVSLPCRCWTGWLPSKLDLYIGEMCHPLRHSLIASASQLREPPFVCLVVVTVFDESERAIHDHNKSHCAIVFVVTGVWRQTSLNLLSGASFSCSYHGYTLARVINRLSLNCIWDICGNVRRFRAILEIHWLQ